VTVIATGFDDLEHGGRRVRSEPEREVRDDRSIEHPAPPPRPPADLENIIPPKTHTFEMDDDLLEIPRFLRDRDENK
jgi:hypothetical protein